MQLDYNTCRERRRPSLSRMVRLVLLVNWLALVSPFCKPTLEASLTSIFIYLDISWADQTRASQPFRPSRTMVRCTIPTSRLLSQKYMKCIYLPTTIFTCSTHPQNNTTYPDSSTPTYISQIHQPNTIQPHYNGKAQTPSPRPRSQTHTQPRKGQGKKHDILLPPHRKALRHLQPMAPKPLQHPHHLTPMARRLCPTSRKNPLKQARQHSHKHDALVRCPNRLRNPHHAQRQDNLHMRRTSLHVPQIPLLRLPPTTAHSSSPAPRPNNKRS